MDTALFFCHACGKRLNADDTQVAVSRGETHATACCAKCAQAGKRIKDPAAFEAQEFRDAQLDTQPPQPEPEPEPAPVETVAVEPRRQPTPPQGSRITARPTTAAAAAARSSRRGGITEPPPKTPASPLVFLGAAAGVVCLLGVFVLLFAGGSAPVAVTAPAPSAPPNPQSPIPNPQSSIPSPAPKPTGFLSSLGQGDKPAVSPAPAAPVENPAMPQSSRRDIPVPPAPAARPAASGPFALVEDLLHYKNFADARRRLDDLDKRTGLEDPNRPKLEALRKQCQDNSRAALDELLKAAAIKAQAGDLNAVRQVLSPQHIQDLLPEDAARAAKELDRLRQAAEAAGKAAQEKRDAEAAALRADFEKSLPEASALPPPKGSVLYGPEGGKAWKDGKESLRRPAGQAPYLDGTRKIAFQGGGILGMVTNEPLVILYSAGEDCEFKVALDMDQFGWRSGAFRFPAGSLRTLELNPNEDGKFPGGKRGKATGRQINGLSLEPKNVKPGTFALFRISR